MKINKIIEGCLRKDKKSWDLFVQKYSKLIYWAIRKRLEASGFEYNQDDIDYIFQEVFLSILNGDKLLQLKNIKTIASWLAVIASNKTIDIMSRKAKENERLMQDMPDFSDDSFRQDIEKRDLMSLLSEVINSLSSKEKIIIGLNLIENRTHKEIAGITDIPINTVSTTIVRAKEKLKKELTKKNFKNL